jgi:branched-chain amino acid aminotransferase
MASCRRRWSWCDDRQPIVSDELPAVWVNGERQPPDGFHISSRDRGLMLADGVFETMRAYAGTVFRLDRHLARLAQSLTGLGIPAPPRLHDWMRDAVQASGRRDASIRLTVTRGIGPAGVPPPDDPRPTVIIAVSPLPVFAAGIYDTGLTAHVASGRRNERAMTAGLKTLAYADAVAAWLEARRAGADEALFLDLEDHCSEATSSNLFVWTDSGTLLTPPVSCGVLPGVTRGAVLELARARGMPGGERAFGLDELLAAKEAFLTSSVREIAPLVRVGAQPIGRGTPGSVTREIAAAYAALVAQETRAGS